MNSRRGFIPVLVAAALLLASLACIGPRALTPKPTATPPGAQTAVSTAAQTLKCKIPDLAGMDQQSAMQSLVSLGLTPVKTLDYSDAIPADSVITTDPPPGTTLETCQGDITLVISMGPRLNTASTLSVPATPLAPTQLPTPDMSSAMDSPMYNTVYQEGFNPLNNGLDPAWKVKINPGGAMSTKDGALVVTGTAIAQVGDASWQNYRITFTSIAGSGYSFVAFFRVQSDTSNSMAMSCINQASTSGGGNVLHCEWYRIVNNARQKITGVYPAEVCTSICNILIEAKDNAYRFVFNGDEQFKFNDTTFKNGGVGFYVNSPTTAWTLSAFDVSTPPHPASPGEILFRDDFKTSAWDVGSYDNEFATYEQKLVSGKYQWHVKAKKGVALKECVKAINLPEVFTLSVDVKLVSGPKDATYALTFRCQDNSNLYYFNISENGPWGLYSLISGTWNKIVSEDTSPVTPGQANHLQVIGDGTNYALILNGHLLRQVKESEFQAGGVGLGVELANPGDEATVEFDNLVINTP
jgi:hypothetical protein